MTRVLPAAGWERALADAAGEQIRDGNLGSWPVTLRQLRRVAGCVGVRIRVLDSLPVPAALVGEFIVCRNSSGVFGRIVHELAEAVLARMETRVPYDPIYVAHRAARLVESDYVRYLRIHRAAERFLADEKQKSEKRQELVYVRDEWCEANL